VVTGFYYDTKFYSHGFLRSANGHFVTFDAIQFGPRTEPLAINSSSVIIGWGDDGEGGIDGFVRSPGGAEELFAVAGAQGSQANAINDSGVIVGYEFSDGGGDEGFERDTSGPSV
jgi:hypothetical protein